MLLLSQQPYSGPFILKGGKKKKRAGCNRYKRYYSRLTFSNKKEPSILVNTRLLGST